MQHALCTLKASALATEVMSYSVHNVVLLCSILCRVLQVPIAKGRPLALKIVNGSEAVTFCSRTHNQRTLSVTTIGKQQSA